MCPIAHTDGHDGPRLIDEVIPGIAAMVDDVVVAFEDAVREPVFAHESQMFSTGFNSADRDGSITMEMLSGTVKLAVVCHPA